VNGGLRPPIIEPLLGRFCRELAHVRSWVSRPGVTSELHECRGRWGQRRVVPAEDLVGVERASCAGVEPWQCGLEPAVAQSEVKPDKLPKVSINLG
jgi:hypothetical protein